MKKLLFVMLLSLVVAGCEKEGTPEDNEPANTGYVKYEGETYTTNKMLVIRDAMWGGCSMFHLCFAPNTVSFDSWAGGPVGTGAGLRLSLCLPDSIYTLPNGTYTNMPDDLEFNYFMNCEVLLNGADWGGYSEDIAAVPTGTLIISKTGSTYTFSFNGSDETSNEVKAYFKGAILKYVANDIKSNPVTKK